MTNTVFGPYAKTVWTNGATPANATNMNHLETQASAALNGVNPDLLSAFILSGVTCAKDGVIANQLDIAAGRAYITLSDGTRGLIIVGADNTHTTSAVSSTYHLYLQPDGTWYWSTSNSPATNSLAICTVTTDTSGNIATVTDNRVTMATLLSGMTGDLSVPHALLFGVGAAGFQSKLGYNTAATNANEYWSPQHGATPLGHLFLTWTGAGQNSAFSVGGQFGSAPAYVDNSGNIYGNIGGGPVQGNANSTSSPSSDTKLVELTIPTAGVYLFWLYLSGSVTDNTFPPAVTMTGYQNGVAIPSQGNAAAGAQSTSASPFSFGLSWCYKVTCAANDKLQLYFKVTSTSTSVNGQALAQYLHA